MKKGSTLVLKGVIIFIGAAVLAVCALVLPRLIILETSESGDFDYGYIFLGLYLTAIPFFIALFQSYKLLALIDQNKAFSDVSVRSLRIIKYSALTISILFSLGMPYIFYMGDKDDAPGVVLIGFIIIFTSFVVAAFSAVLARLLKNALDIKKENELTV